MNRGVDRLLHRPNMETHEADSEAGAGMIARIKQHNYYICCNNSVYEYATSRMRSCSSECMRLVRYTQNSSDSSCQTHFWILFSNIVSF